MPSDQQIEAVPERARQSGSSETDQKLHGTLFQHLAAIDVAFKTLAESGVSASDPTLFRKTCEEILRMHETERLEAEHNIKRYEHAIVYERAKQRSATLHSSLIVGVLTSYTAKAIQGEVIAPTKLPHNVDPVTAAQPAPMTEEEARNVYCICGCTDATDAAACTCACHRGTPCGDKRCIVCTKWATNGRIVDGTVIVSAQPSRKPASKKAASRKAQAARG